MKLRNSCRNACHQLALRVILAEPGFQYCDSTFHTNMTVWIPASSCIIWEISVWRLVWTFFFPTQLILFSLGFIPTWFSHFPYPTSWFHCFQNTSPSHWKESAIYWLCKFDLITAEKSTMNWFHGSEQVTKTTLGSVGSPGGLTVGEAFTVS